MDRDAIRDIGRRERDARIKWVRRAGWVLFAISVGWAFLAPWLSDAKLPQLLLGPLILAVISGLLIAAGDLSKLLDMRKK